MPSAGRLEPGVTYVYEREGGRTYARKMGETKRILIGEDYPLDLSNQQRKIFNEWVPIVQSAEHNPALQDALDRAKLIYELSKRDDPLFHHPV